MSKRCEWCGSDPLYIDYHDNEWGRPTTDDNKLFEFLILESAQAGLSWITILRKREAYRKAYFGFDPQTVANFTEHDIEDLIMNPGIIRNRLKITSSVKNALLFIEIQKEYGSFYLYLKSFFNMELPLINHPLSIADVPVTSIESDNISKDMRKRGFKFFGSTICYAFLQATGFIDDHIESCMYKTKKG